MESFITEILPPFQAPSRDARLVLFTDEAIRRDRAEVARQLHQYTQYTAKYGVYLISGLLELDGNLCLCMFGPKGEPVLRQPALHLSLPLRTAGLAAASEIELARTELGSFYLCVDTDILHPQTVRTAALKGADVVFSVQHIDPVTETSGRIMDSVWNAAQTNNLYVVNLSGGARTVCCPAPVTRAGDGYLVRHTGNSPCRFGLNLERLDQVREGFPVMERMNASLIQNYAEELGLGR